MLQALCACMQIDQVLGDQIGINGSSGDGPVQCLVLCRTFGEVDQPRCNVWNYCDSATGSCEYTSAGYSSVDSGTCTYGYNRVAALNEPIDSINRGGDGYQSGGHVSLLACL